MKWADAAGKMVTTDLPRAWGPQSLLSGVLVLEGEGIGEWQVQEALADFSLNQVIKTSCER